MGDRENKVERYLNRQFKLRGGMTRKWVSPGYVGVPDRICILNGNVYFVEVKTHDGELSPMQQREINRLLEAGVSVWVVYGEADVDRMMEKIGL